MFGSALKACQSTDLGVCLHSHQGFSVRSPGKPYRNTRRGLQHSLAAVLQPLSCLHAKWHPGKSSSAHFYSRKTPRTFQQGASALPSLLTCNAALTALLLLQLAPKEQEQVTVSGLIGLPTLDRWWGCITACPACPLSTYSGLCFSLKN